MPTIAPATIKAAAAPNDLLAKSSREVGVIIYGNTNLGESMCLENVFTSYKALSK